MIAAPRFLNRFVLVTAFLLLICNKSSAIRHLDSSRYFADAEVAAFVDDVQNGDTARAKKALAAGISANALGISGFRPIHFVFAAKDAEVLKLLLAAGADPMARLDNGNTPLHFAVRMPNPDFTRVLLAAGADPNAIGENEKPVFREALSSREPENLRLLAKAGANINVVWGGSTPLMGAIISFSWVMAATLIDMNADVSFKNRHNENAVDIFCEQVHKLSPTPTNSKGIPAIYAAFKRRDVAIPCEAEIQKFRQYSH